MELKELQAIMEAIIYVADDPVKPEQFKEVFSDQSFDKIEEALRNLVESFNSRAGGMLIREVAGGYRMTTRPEYHEHIRSYLKTKPSAKLSMAALAIASLPNNNIRLSISSVSSLCIGPSLIGE